MRVQNLQSVLAVGLVVLSTTGTPLAGAQTQNGAAAQPPNAPTAQATLAAGTQTQGKYTPLRSTAHDYSRGKQEWYNPVSQYTQIQVPAPTYTNSPRIDDLYRDGKIYLSLDDAILLALENNYDIAIARYNLDIADTDLLRARSGLSFLGVNNGLLTGTMGGSTSPVFSSSGAAAPTSSSSSSTTTAATSTPLVQTTGAVGGGPGGTSAGAGGAASGPNGINQTTLGAGPLVTLPEQLDPSISGTIQLERSHTPQGSNFSTNSFTLDQNQDEYNFNYNQGFLTGTSIAATFDNMRTTSNSIFNFYSPTINTSFNVQITQHLLQGFGPHVNGRYIAITKNNRRITDASFRAQLLYTIDQVENIYWGLVGAYEDVQAKQGALAQSQQLESDDEKQLQIGTLAPLDVVNAKANVASDQQALIAAQTKLEYQELIMKQAIARNLNDAIFAAAPVIPTDRVSLAQTLEEQEPVDQLVQETYANSPTIEEAKLALKNQEITIKSVHNALLPQLDVYGFYGAAGLGGSQSPLITCKGGGFFNPCSGVPATSIPYSTAFGNMFNGSGSTKGAGINLTLPLRNRQAQAQQARAMLEYRQSQMLLQQTYLKLRMNVINQIYALQNDRATVQSAQASLVYAQQSLDAEKKKYHLGASTTANVLLQQRSLETAQDNLISAQTTYAVDRAALSELVADTLDKYDIDIVEAAAGKLEHAPQVPGLEAPEKQAAPQPLHPGETPATPGSSVQTTQP